MRLNQVALNPFMEYSSILFTSLKYLFRHISIIQAKCLIKNNHKFHKIFLFGNILIPIKRIINNYGGNFKLWALRELMAPINI